VNKKNYRVLVPVLIALIAGLAGGYWFATQTRQHTSQEKAGQQMEGKKTEKNKILFYRNPMNPAITSPVPAKDEMGMDYIPVYANDSSKTKEPAGTVLINPVVEQDIGVRTAIARKKVLNKEVRAVGRVDYDEELLYRIHPKIEGWIEKLYVKKTGEEIQKDTILLSIYSPQLVASEQEYLLALKNLQALGNSPIADIRNGAEELVESSKKRLEFLDVPEHQLKELTENRVVKKDLHIHSPYKGVVLDIGIREGDYVTPKTMMYTLADLSKVWVEVDVYEFDLPWIKENDIAEMTLAAVPGRVFSGSVAYIYPYMEKKTRTVKVRLEFDNSEGLLKPEMFANVTIKAGRNIEAIVVPSEAIIRSGERDQVFIKRGEGKFEPREVKIGVTASGMTQILEGVAEGEEVVTSSQFLIDSESKLREATAKMMENLSAPPAGKKVTAKGKAEDMDMGDMNLDNINKGDLDMSDMNLESLKK